MSTSGQITQIRGKVSIGSDPHEDLSADLEALTVAAGGSPVIRVYSWDAPTVIIGYNQPLDDVDMAFCRSHGIAVFRRGSGGRGVIHHGDLGVSLAVPMSHPWGGGIPRLYHAFGTALAEALRAFSYPVEPLHGDAGGPDSPVCFEHHGHDGLFLGGKRVFGSAQVRRQGSVMIHGTLLRGFDAELHASVFGVSPTRLRQRITSLGASDRREEIARALHESLSAHVFGGEITILNEVRGGRLPHAAAATHEGGVNATNDNL